MEIKILVPENRKEDLEKFINNCKDQGFEIVNQGGGRMPNFSGYYATLKGISWGDNPYKGKADKWDKLDEEIGKAYDDDNPTEQDLTDIGISAAEAFGYL